MIFLGATPAPIPPRPWRIAVPQPRDGDRVYLIDAEDHQVLDASLPRALATVIAVAVTRLSDEQITAIVESVEP